MTKFCNYYLSGEKSHNTTFPDADFFLMRTAEAYLTFAEADARLNGGTTSAEGTAAVNAVRSRAHATTLPSFNLDQLLNEWSREFYFEGRRRTDLIRHGKFGGSNNYSWQWKGGAKAGVNFSANLNLFAIPDTELNANPNLKQNTGY